MMTMTREELKNGLVRLYSSNGIRDKRNGQVFEEVVCKAKDVKHFEAL